MKVMTFFALNNFYVRKYRKVLSTKETASIPKLAATRVSEKGQYLSLARSLQVVHDRSVGQAVMISFRTFIVCSFNQCTCKRRDNKKNTSNLYI